MSGVRILHFFERLMEIHSNPPKLYYGFKHVKCALVVLRGTFSYVVAGQLHFVKKLLSQCDCILMSTKHTWLC